MLNLFEGFMRIGFYSPHMTLRGTEVTMYDFADHNEKILGNKSFIFYNTNHKLNDSSTIDKFKLRFGERCIGIGEPDEADFTWKRHRTVPLLEDMVDKFGIDGMYMQKFGNNDGIVLSNSNTFVLVAAPVCQPHGTVYAYVSEWLSHKASNGRYPAVPSMVTDLSEIKPSVDFRQRFDIPASHIVFSRTGGQDSWNIPWATEAISIALQRRQDIWFLMQNTPLGIAHERIIHIPATADLGIKKSLILASDAMIHARKEGESFGCAIGEYSNMNRPIITWDGSKDINHLVLLADKAITFTDQTQLINILCNFKKEDKDYRSGYIFYNAKNTMDIFNSVFLSTIKK